VAVRVIGIDPGSKSPSAALYVDDPLSKCGVVDAIDIPMMDGDGGRAVDVLAFSRWIDRNGATHATIERATAMPSIEEVDEFGRPTGERRGMGGASIGKYMACYGDLRSCVRLCGLAVSFVMPAVWKKSFGIRGSNKRHSLDLARELFPEGAQFFERLKDEGRAEAALIARWAKGKLTGR
jgi:hypothetical protein